MKKIGVAGLQREQIKKTIEATAPGCFDHGGLCGLHIVARIICRRIVVEISF